MPIVLSVVVRRGVKQIQCPIGLARIDTILLIVLPISSRNPKTQKLKNSKTQNVLKILKISLVNLKIF